VEARWIDVEAETAAFGGGPAMQIANKLFTADSRAILRRAAARTTEGLPRRELSVLLCNTLATSAGLEWYERGDLFARVANDRPLPNDVDAHDIARLANGLTILLHANPSPDGPVFGPGQPGVEHADQATAFGDTGRQLADLHHAGTLGRGLCHILAYHLIFHWKRAGLPARTQALLGGRCQWRPTRSRRRPGVPRRFWTCATSFRAHGISLPAQRTLIMPPPRAVAKVTNSDAVSALTIRPIGAAVGLSTQRTTCAAWSVTPGSWRTGRYASASLYQKSRGRRQ
jgi:hypothetical protein